MTHWHELLLELLRRHTLSNNSHATLTRKALQHVPLFTDLLHLGLHKLAELLVGFAQQRFRGLTRFSLDLKYLPQLGRALFLPE